jgi:glutaredoxin 3
VSAPKIWAGNSSKKPKKLRGTNMVKNITIFTTNTCSYCQMVKKYLGAKGMTYEEVNLDEHPHRQAEALQMSGAMTVPVTVVTKADDSQEVIVGYNLARLAPAVA